MNSTWAQPKTLAEWRDRIYKSLGGAQWNVELDTASLDHAIWQTLGLFNKYRPIWRWRPLGRLEGEQQIDLSGETENGVRVVDVKFMKDENYFGYNYSEFNHTLLGMAYPRRAYQQLVAEDRYAFLLGSSPIWQWDETTKKLFINVKGRGVFATALLLVPNSVEQIPFHIETDFLEGAVGYAKLILSRIMGQFGAIPAAQGDITTDANELRSEGKDAIASLERKLDKSMRHMPPRPIFG